MMVRRGRGFSKSKAKKNSGNSQHSRVSKVALLLVAAVVLALVVPFDSFGADETATVSPVVSTASAPPTPSVEEREQARNWYKVGMVHRAKAHKYHHAIPTTVGHLPGTHGALPYTGLLKYEKARALIWKKRADLWYAKYQAYVKSIRPCVRAGFPEWYCPIIKKAAADEGVSRWYMDPDLAWVIRHESGFRPCVRNGGVIDCGYRGDRAWGLFQFLGSTWAGTGIAQTSDAYWQTRAGIRYIKNRYYSPAGAKRFWLANRWY
jgi:hypothetical protein